MKAKSKFLIAAANSGAGKTTLTLGLLRALTNRGVDVQPFKCGPDYIDTKLHTMASGKESVNLDLFMSSEIHVDRVFRKYSQTSQVSLVEGVMGLFDGYAKMKGSAAEIAKLLDIPIILVVNAKASAYSVAALIYGFKNFDPKVKIAGVIFNFVGSESHYSFLKDACEDVGVEALGYLPKNIAFEIPSRHLGLDTDNSAEIESVLKTISTVVEKQLDIDKLLAVTSYTPSEQPMEELATAKKRMRIAVAKDEAFTFMYRENIAALETVGDVTYFSPIRDKKLPQSDLVYLPGGYPELHAQSLSENEEMKQSVRDYVESGGKVFAECGGMMYLTTNLTTQAGESWPMVGVFQAESSLNPMKLSLGYRYFEKDGMCFKGHEFHYSNTTFQAESIVQQYGAKQQPVLTKLVRYKNVIAGYTHVYWADTPNWLDIFK